MPSFTLDHHGGDTVPRIEPGDVILSARLVYRVLDVRPVESTIWPDRWRLRLERLCQRRKWDGRFGVEPGARVHESYAYQPGERPTDNPCDLPNCEGCRSGHH